MSVWYRLISVRIIVIGVGLLLISVGSLWMLVGFVLNSVWSLKVVGED